MEIQRVQNKPIPQKPVEREPQPQPKVEKPKPSNNQVDVLV